MSSIKLISFAATKSSKGFSLHTEPWVLEQRDEVEEEEEEAGEEVQSSATTLAGRMKEQE